MSGFGRDSPQGRVSNLSGQGGVDDRYSSRQPGSGNGISGEPTINERTPVQDTPSTVSESKSRHISHSKLFAVLYGTINKIATT
jgi:hypothetical protein